MKLKLPSVPGKYLTFDRPVWCLDRVPDLTNAKTAILCVCPPRGNGADAIFVLGAAARLSKAHVNNGLQRLPNAKFKFPQSPTTTANCPTLNAVGPKIPQNRRQRQCQQPSQARPSAAPQNVEQGRPETVPGAHRWPGAVGEVARHLRPSVSVAADARRTFPVCLARPRAVPARAGASPSPTSHRGPHVASLVFRRGSNGSRGGCGWMSADQRGPQAR